MKFLIIGSSGFLGSHALTLARSQGFTAIGTQARSQHPDLIKFDLLTDRLEATLSSASFEIDRQTFGIICAAVTPMDRCVQDFEGSYRIMVENTILLIEDMYALGIKPVFISTSFVFDGNLGYYTEQHPHAPISEYGRNKALVEDYLSKNRPDSLILRLDKIVGDRPAENHLFSEWYQLIKKAEPIVCIEGQLFSPTLVQDIARAIVLSCKADLKGLYNATNSEFFTREELARQFIAALNLETDIVSRPQTAFNFLSKRPLKSYLDSTKLRKAIGIRFTSMREAIQSFKSLHPEIE